MKENPVRRGTLTKSQIAADLNVSTRHVDRLKIPGKTYAFGPRSPRWWADEYAQWRDGFRSRDTAA